MDYLWLKALHIIVAITWIGGMLTVAGTTAAFAGLSGSDVNRAQFFARIRKWDRLITTPAMIAVWVLGLTLAVTGQWFPQPWIEAKIAIVLALSAFHGMLSGRLRRLATGQISKGKASQVGYVIIIAAVTLIVFLVVVKPF